MISEGFDVAFLSRLAGIMCSQLRRRRSTVVAMALAQALSTLCVAVF